MKTLTLIFVTVVTTCAVYAQKPDIALTTDDIVYTSPVEVMPEYKGGMERLYERLQNNIRYIFLDRMKEIQGLVLVSMVIEKDGSVNEVKMLKGLSEEQDREVLRVVKNLRKFKPGLHEGKPVRVQLTIPVDFKIIKA